MHMTGGQIGLLKEEQKGSIRQRTDWDKTSTVKRKQMLQKKSSLECSDIEIAL